jgi:hypothetical protein
MEVGAKNYCPTTTVTAMAPNTSDSSTSPGNRGTAGGQEQGELADLVVQLVSGKVNRQNMLRLARLLGRYVRVGRKGVRLNGKGIVDLLMYIAPRLPVRTPEQLQSAYGVSGGSLAGKVIKGASRSSAAVGGATGALATAGELAPPLWLTLPAEILAETILVTAVEMRLIAELHGLFDVPIEGTPDERAQAIVEAWSTRRGVNMKKLKKSGVSELERDRGVAKHVTGVVKRKLIGRAMRNLGTLAPLFVGAAIGAETNRRSTRDIGNAIIRDLRKHAAVADRHGHRP